MDERDIAEKVITSCKAGLPGSLVVKHNDMGTVGIPDIQVAGVGGYTSWAELKLQRVGESLKSINKAQQLVFCHELAQVNNGRCWVVVYEMGAEPTVVVYQPRVLFRNLWPNVAGPDPARPKGGKPRLPVELPDLKPSAGLVSTLLSFGALRVPWTYDIVTQLVKDSVAQ